MDNLWFWSAFAVFMLGSIPLLLYPQGSLLIQINEHRTNTLDTFFRIFTKVGEAYGYLAVFFILFVYKRRAAWGVPILGLGVSLLAWIGKTLFQHPRPYLYFQRQGILSELEWIPGVHINKGLTSFPSGHTMAAFALFSFLAFCFPRKPWLGISCFMIALLVGVSRMYLVQHFFKDVYTGACLGAVMGILAYQVLNQFEQKLAVKV